MAASILSRRLASSCQVGLVMRIAVAVVMSSISMTFERRVQNVQSTSYRRHPISQRLEDHDISAAFNSCNCHGLSQSSRLRRQSDTRAQVSASSKLQGASGFPKDWGWHSKEIEIPAEDGTKLRAYMTEEVLKESRSGDRPRSDRAVLLLPGEYGFASERTRKLADRVAIFCEALVLVPDLLAGAAPLPASELPPDDAALAEWSAGALPPDRVAKDVRTSMIYLRADHRVGRIALLGAGIGAQLVLRTLSREGTTLTAGIAFCPPFVQRDLLIRPDASLCLVFDEKDDEKADLARDCFTQVILRERAAVPKNTIDTDKEGPPAKTGNATAEMKVESISKLRRLKVAELRERLEAFGASTEGRKPELVERLHQFFTAEANLHQEAEETLQPPVEYTSDEKLTWKQLQEDNDRLIVRQFPGLREHFANPDEPPEEEEIDYSIDFKVREEMARQVSGPEKAMVLAESYLNAWLNGDPEKRLKDSWMMKLLKGPLRDELEYEHSDGRFVGPF